MNLFRLAGDLTHLASFVVLLLKILATRSCRGKRMNPGRPPSWKRQRSFSKKKKNIVFQLPSVDGHQSHLFFPFSPLSKNRHLPPDAGALHARLRVPLPGPVYPVRERQKERKKREKDEQPTSSSFLPLLLLLPPRPPPKTTTTSSSSALDSPPRLHPPPPHPTATSPSTTP